MEIKLTNTSAELVRVKEEHNHSAAPIDLSPVSGSWAFSLTGIIYLTVIFTMGFAMEVFGSKHGLLCITFGCFVSAVYKPVRPWRMVRDCVSQREAIKMLVAQFAVDEQLLAYVMTMMAFAPRNGNTIRDIRAKCLSWIQHNRKRWDEVDKCDQVSKCIAAAMPVTAFEENVIGWWDSVSAWSGMEAITAFVRGGETAGFGGSLPKA
jgi:hypothetical protein